MFRQMEEKFAKSRTERMEKLGFFKKNGMEKLIELLNEYVEKYNKSDLYYKFELENGELYCYNDVSDILWTMQDEAMVICSKKFGFIKWLVENDKIYEEKIPDKFEGYYYETREYVFDKASILLMELAIKDNPIEFLVSIIK